MHVVIPFLEFVHVLVDGLENDANTLARLAPMDLNVSKHANASKIADVIQYRESVSALMAGVVH
ncbi:hypothetical protein QYM36_016776, partial [Artemia franciscana]